MTTEKELRKTLEQLGEKYFTVELEMKLEKELKQEERLEKLVKKAEPEDQTE